MKLCDLKTQNRREEKKSDGPLLLLCINWRYKSPNKQSFAQHVSGLILAN